MAFQQFGLKIKTSQAQNCWIGMVILIDVFQDDFFLKSSKQKNRNWVYSTKIVKQAIWKAAYVKRKEKKEKYKNSNIKTFSYFSAEFF